MIPSEHITFVGVDGVALIAYLFVRSRSDAVGHKCPDVAEHRLTLYLAGYHRR